MAALPAVTVEKCRRDYFSVSSILWGNPLEKLKKIIGFLIHFLFEVCVGMIAGHFPAIIIGLALYIVAMGVREWIEIILSG